MAKTARNADLNGMVISDTAIKQPVFITMIMSLIVVLGVLAYSTMPVNLLPDIDIPTIAVGISYPGAGPESMAEQVAKPVEDQLITLNGLDHITSNSKEGFTQFIIQFKTNVSVNQALQDVRDKVNAVMPTLPQDVNDPIFQKFDPNQQPILTLAISSKSGQSPLELRRIVDDEIVPRLQQAQGVGSVDVGGGEVRQINVLMDLNKLKAWSILPVQITRAIKSANADRGLGTITTGDQDISLRAPSMLATPQDISRIQITGTPYRIGDVAVIEDSVAEIKGYSRLDGKDSIALNIRRQSGTNLVQVADNVKAEMNKVFAEHPDLNYFVPQDQSVDVRESTQSAIDELLIAAVSALLVVFIFFRDLRNTVTTIAGLPVIMIGTFAAISLFGITINLVSLLALSVSVGLVIDDAIVVRENIFRQMERGVPPRIAASRGTAQVALSVLAMSLTIIAVFLPVAFTSGVTGIIFKSFGITVACAMVISLVEAFTLAPMLSAFWFKQKKGTEHLAAAHAEPLTAEEEVLEEANEPLGWMARWYEGILLWTLRHRWVVVLTTLLVFAASIVAAGGLKFAFFPSSDSHEFALGYELPPGTPLAKTDELARRVEQLIMEDHAVDAVQSTIGGDGTAEKASFYVKLHEEEPTLVVQDRIRDQLSFVPGLVAGKPSFQGVSTDISARDIQMSVQTAGPLKDLEPLLLEFQSQLQGSSGNAALVDVDTTYKPGKPEIDFHLDPAKIGSLGFTNEDIASSVRALVNGETATTYREGGDEFDIVVKLAGSDGSTRIGVDAIRAISVPTAGGGVPLSSLGTIDLTSGTTTVRRYDRLNQIIIGANVRQGYNVSEVQQQIAAAVDKMQKPAGAQISFVGSAQSQNEGFTTLFIAMGLSIVFVYMVLASQFGSFLQPFVIMLAMPFSFIGAFLALRLTRIDLSIFGMIGLIMLLGLVVKNSILMVDFANRLRAAGMEKHPALSRAAAIRLRPILMTTTALVVGSLPAAIGLGEGAEIRRALSVVVIGGLITSMFLTLLMIPTAYSLLDSFTVGSKRLLGWRPWRRKAPTPVVADAQLAASAEQSGNLSMVSPGNGHTDGATPHVEVPRDENRHASRQQADTAEDTLPANQTRSSTD